MKRNGDTLADTLILLSFTLFVASSRLLDTALEMFVKSVVPFKSV